MSPDARPDQLQLAVERTEVAYQRTLLAEERTFSAWVRTGLASIATGFAIAKLMSDAGPAWVIRLLGALFISVGAFMFILALYAYRAALHRMPQPAAGGTSIWILGSLSFALLVGAAVMLVLTFL